MTNWTSSLGSEKDFWTVSIKYYLLPQTIHLHLVGPYPTSVKDDFFYEMVQVLFNCTYVPFLVGLRHQTKKFFVYFYEDCFVIWITLMVLSSFIVRSASNHFQPSIFFFPLLHHTSTLIYSRLSQNPKQILYLYCTWQWPMIPANHDSVKRPKMGKCKSFFFWQMIFLELFEIIFLRPKVNFLKFSLIFNPY